MKALEWNRVAGKNAWGKKQRSSAKDFGLDLTACEKMNHFKQGMRQQDQFPELRTALKKCDMLVPFRNLQPSWGRWVNLVS